MELENKLKLNQGDKLIEVSHKMKGPLQETDVYKYNIVDQNENIVGYVDHTDHTSIKGFQRTQTATQYDIDRKVVLDITW